MRARRSLWWTFVAIAVVLLLWGWFVLGFLAEPSAVGRMRTALVAIGIGSIVIGLAGGLVGVWMLIVRRT